MNANSRIAQPVPVDPIPRRPAQASGAATPLLSIPMDLRPPRSGGVTGSIVRSSEDEQR
jgi:hypothetical protein